MCEHTVNGRRVCIVQEKYCQVSAIAGKMSRNWESFEFDVESWKELLDDGNVDLNARRDLFLLAQYGEEGKKAANDILFKLVKKLTDGVPMNNASAFVHSCVKNARHRIQ